ncbi:hypothetical protein K438DRAFT_1835434 [Mycena galopus ATCC 62051]|nr:hypothetical protein K438DRAFT_1835434 [Mycena galopus ATCC 62051]
MNERESADEQICDTAQSLVIQEPSKGSTSVDEAAVSVQPVCQASSILSDFNIEPFQFQNHASRFSNSWFNIEPFQFQNHASRFNNSWFNIGPFQFQNHASRFSNSWFGFKLKRKPRPGSSVTGYNRFDI